MDNTSIASFRRFTIPLMIKLYPKLLPRPLTLTQADYLRQIRRNRQPKKTEQIHDWTKDGF